MRGAFVLGISFFEVFRECLQLVLELLLGRMQAVDSLILFDHNHVQLLEIELQMRDDRLEMDQFLQYFRGIHHVSSFSNKFGTESMGPDRLWRITLPSDREIK